jgi:hypothetical protein
MCRKTESYRTHDYTVWAECRVFSIKLGSTYTDHWTLERYSAKQTYLYQVLREVTEMLDSCNMFTVLVIVLKPRFKSVKRCNPKVIHFARIWFSEGIQHKP